MQRFFKVFLLVCCLAFSKSNFSQDIRGAWIDYKWMSGYTYSITLHLIIDTTNKVNRPFLTTYFGDGDSTAITTYTITSGKIQIYVYSFTHTYFGPGNYKLQFTDKYRVTGIKNMVNSVTKPIYVESFLSINQFMGPNSSVITTNYPISFTGVIGNQVKWNPGAYDPDGDSLSYQLINCAITPTTSYYLPSNATVDAYGTLSFSKDSVGLYGFAYLIKEWRGSSSNYTLIGSVLMDFAMDIPAGVGIKEFDKKESIKIYPNPVSNILNIKSDSKTNSTIEIINYLGQTVLKQNYSESIDVSKLESGYYILKISGEKNYYSKFVKE